MVPHMFGSLDKAEQTDKNDTEGDSTYDIVNIIDYGEEFSEQQQISVTHESLSDLYRPKSLTRRCSQGRSPGSLDILELLHDKLYFKVALWESYWNLFTQSS